MPVDAFDPCLDLLELADVERLVDLLEPFGRYRFKSDENADTTRFCREQEELFIVSEIHRDLRDPLLAYPRFDDRPEELLGPRNVVGSRSDEIVINHKNQLFPDGPEFFNDPGNRTVPVMPSVERGDAAEIAGKGAAPRRLDRADPVPVLQ